MSDIRKALISPSGVAEKMILAHRRLVTIPGTSAGSMKKKRKKALIFLNAQLCSNSAKNIVNRFPNIIPLKVRINAFLKESQKRVSVNSVTKFSKLFQFANVPFQSVNEYMIALIGG